MELNIYEDVLCFAAGKHRGQKRKDGKTEYILHPLTVSEILRQAGFGKEYVLTALLHDVLEDTATTAAELHELVTDDIVHAVELLTRREGMDERDYLQGILSDSLASVVKSADKSCNLWECVRNGTPGQRMKSADLDFARRYIDKTAEYYGGQLSQAVDCGLAQAKIALNEALVLPGGPVPVLEHAAYIPYRELQVLNRQAALDSYNRTAGLPDLDGPDVKFYQVGSRLYLDEHASLGFLVRRPMWIMSQTGWRPIEVDLFPVYEDLDVLEREEAAEEIEALRADGFIHDFVTRRLV